MSINLNTFFIDEKIPLEKVQIEEMEPGCTYITLDGSRIEVAQDGDIILVKTSPLKDGEKVTTLAPKALELLFRLLNKPEYE